MLNTLHKIGEQLLEGQGIWARVVTEPKYDPDKTNWVCPILFDCIEKEIRFLKNDMELFEKDKSILEHRYIDSECWGRRGKKCALTIEPKKFQMLEETLFGKKEGSLGSMMESVQDFDPELEETSFFSALEVINKQLSDYRSVLDLQELKDELNFGRDEEVVLFYSIIKSDDINNGEPTKLTSLDGYKDFIIGKFATPEGLEKGINYINGNSSEEVIEATFSGRYNIHKVFQTTASNYASGFSDFKKNFQSSPDTLAALDKASEYILEHLQTRIAGVSHIIVPSFLSKDLNKFDVDETELFLKNESDLLFKYQPLQTAIEKEFSGVDVFWVNYIAFESDGNSFKIMNHIKDVNSHYLRKVIEAFAWAGIEFKRFIGDKYRFNLQSVYFIIPVRDGQKSKKNKALNFFKSILEQQKIDSDLLYQNFIELTLCYWYGRYRAFQNIKERESFDYAVKDAVFKYSALIYALKKLNLIDMETETNSSEKKSENSQSEYQQRIEDFFDKMKYSEQEKAMFYLGRVLSEIAYAQYKKGHESKPVLNKINFNGMDADSILRFSNDLGEKTRQYNIHRSTYWDFSRFRERFSDKDWSLSKERSVFYLMAGYSFGLTKSDND